MSDIVLTKEAAPLTPPAGTVSLHVMPDGMLYRKDETGTDTAFVAAGDLGTAAFQNTTAFDAAGAAAAAQAASDPAGSAAAVLSTSAQKANNLSDLANAATARTNLGLGTAAVHADTDFDAAGAAAAVLSSSLQKANNLSDLVSAPTARTNLGLGTAATQNSTAFDSAGAAAAAQAASDPVGSASSAVSAHVAVADPHTAYLKADGTRALSANMPIGSKKFTNVAQASGAGEFVEYAQWQAAIAGSHWLLPVLDPGVIDDSLNTPPGSPIREQTYLVGASPTGAWSGLSGRLVWYDSTVTGWVDVLGRAIIVGDMIGIAFEGGTLGGSFSGNGNKIATVTNATPGSYAYTYYTPANTDTTWANGPHSEHLGDVYNFNGSVWIETPGPIEQIPGAGLSKTGSTWNVNVDNTTVQVNGSNQLIVPTGVFDTSGAAAAAQAAAQASSLQKASNLSDLVSASTARTNLGLGTAATQNSTAFDAAGAAAAVLSTSLQKASNLSDLTSASTARTNLGLGTAATQNSTAFDASGAASSAQAYAIQRANHTGTQLAATISDFASSVIATVLTGFSAGANVAIAATDTILQAFQKVQGQINQVKADAAVWTELITTATLTNTSNVTNTNITELQMTCTAGKTYRIEGTLLWRATSTARSVSLSMNTPDTAAGNIACAVRLPVAVDGTACGYEGAITTLGDSVVGTGCQAANTTYVAKVEGVFVCTTGGTLLPQFHSTTSGNTASLMVGSVMLWREF